jgi:hypothetical protein
MEGSFEQALIEVWRQALVENAEAVELGAERSPVRQTLKRHLQFAHSRKHLCHTCEFFIRKAMVRPLVSFVLLADCMEHRVLVS